jgi:hypothetical protein
MHDIHTLLDWPGEMAATVRLCRLDGSEVSVRLRFLGFDSCEFECSHALKCGEQVNLHVYRMGWIRARITSRQEYLFEAEFDQECPV